MAIKFSVLLSYIQYLLKSGTRHSVHSPFVYKLVDEIIRNKHINPEVNLVNNFVDKASTNSQLIEFKVYGGKADSLLAESRIQSIGSIVKKSSINKKYGKLIFGLVEYFKPEVIIELGTSVGISTLYLSKAGFKAKVFTIEGCNSKSKIARDVFTKMQCDNIELFTGKFETVLPHVLQKAGNIDFAFVDGDHTFNATLSNFETILTYSHNDTVIVFDDIYWSQAMKQAWKQICDHERVTVSIDLFRIGIVFLKAELSKQKFIIRF